MRLFIASDHAGLELKKSLLDFLLVKNIQVEDLGPNSTESVDYPSYANLLSKKIVEEEGNKGILICGTGIGMSMAANKNKGIRAALCFNTVMSHFARAHNDANVLCMGARIIGDEVAKNIVDIFLNTDFQWGRHKKRIEMLGQEVEPKPTEENIDIGDIQY